MRRQLAPATMILKPHIEPRLRRGLHLWKVHLVLQLVMLASPTYLSCMPLFAVGVELSP